MITRVPGFAVGHASDYKNLTGCTVVLCPPGTAGSVDVRGSAAGTRQLDALLGFHIVNEIHAVFISGGSAFGLDAAGGVMEYLEERGRGFDVAITRVPIVPTAVIYDLSLGNCRSRPDKAMGYAACQAARAESQIASNGGFASGTELVAHFGLGDATVVTTLRVEWPSGNVQELSNQALDRMIKVTEPISITPNRPSGSLGATVSLTQSLVPAASYQWRFDGVDLVGQTNRILTLSNLTADMGGRYSVVVSNATTFTTNFTYLTVDTQFTKITAEPWSTDLGNGGVGVAGDYDSDGYLDFALCVSGNVTRIYRNNGGAFTDIGVTLPGVANGAMAWADYANALPGDSQRLTFSGI